MGWFTNEITLIRKKTVKFNWKFISSLEIFKNEKLSYKISLVSYFQVSKF